MKLDIIVSTAKKVIYEIYSKIHSPLFFIALGFLLIYSVTGQTFEAMFSQEKCIVWFTSIKSFAWVIGILLLISDILLPIPATGIMAALGAVYGVWIGWLISMAGSVSAGLIGYGAARYLGQKGSRWIASENEICTYKLFFDQWGAYAIIIGRIIPLLPEVITILAGLSKMRFLLFFSALLIGAMPVSLLFAWMGSYPGFSSGEGIFYAVLIPILVWPLFVKLVKF